MKVGRVVGRVVLNQKVPELPNGRWLLVSPCGRDELENQDESRVSSQPTLVVYDDLGGGTGDWIGYTEGGEAVRPFASPVPVDAYNCCLLDEVEFAKG